MKRILISLVTSLTVLAAVGATKEVSHVRVGLYYEPGFSAREPDGRLVGANVDCIDRIAQYCGWEVEWVAGDFERLVADLESGEIDVLPGLTANPDRLQRLRFPHLPCVMRRERLFVHPASPYQEDSVSGWDDAVIATGPDSSANDALQRMLDENGTRCEVRRYGSTVSAALGFYRGEGQILQAVDSYVFADSRILYSFPTVPSYVVASPKRPDLQAAIEAAIVRINAETPYFYDEVSRRHFMTSSAKSIYFTLEERLYLRTMICNATPIRVEISPVVEPLKSWDASAAKVSGFMGEVADVLCQRTGLLFQFVPPTDDLLARDRYESGEIDIWADFNAYTAGLTRRYEPVESITFPRMFICRRGWKSKDPLSGRVAITDWERQHLRPETRDTMDNIMLCVTLEDCVKAVKDGKADCTLCSIGRAALMLRTYDYSNSLELRLADTRLGRTVFPISFSPKCDPRLVSIVTKVLASLDDGTIESCLETVITDMVRNRSIRPLEILLLALVLVGVAFVVGGFLVFRRVRRKGVEMQLRERTARGRDYMLGNGVKSFIASLDLIISRAEFIRNPVTSREQTNDWSNAILKCAREMSERLHDFDRDLEARRHAENKVLKTRDVVDGGVKS